MKVAKMEEILFQFFERNELLHKNPENKKKEENHKGELKDSKNIKTEILLSAQIFIGIFNNCHLPLISSLYPGHSRHAADSFPRPDLPVAMRISSSAPAGIPSSVHSTALPSTGTSGGKAREAVQAWQGPGKHTDLSLFVVQMETVGKACIPSTIR